MATADATDWTRITAEPQPVTRDNLDAVVAPDRYITRALLAQGLPLFVADGLVTARAGTTIIEFVEADGVVHIRAWSTKRGPAVLADSLDVDVVTDADRDDVAADITGWFRTLAGEAAIRVPSCQPLTARVILDIEVDPQMWESERGVSATDPGAVIEDVRGYILNHVQGSVSADGGGLTAVELYPA